MFYFIPMGVCMPKSRFVIGGLLRWPSNRLPRGKRDSNGHTADRVSYGIGQDDDEHLT